MTDSTSGYAGDIAPRDAWDLLAENDGAVLVDVRTRPEWAFVGVPDTSSLGKPVHRIEWSLFPSGEVNPRFLDELAAAGVEPGDGRPILFLCRSGHRSQAAAVTATRAGYGPAYNIADGFEGHLDADRHRGGSGWRAEGLPWVQS